VLLRTVNHVATTAVEIWQALSDELRAFLRSRVSNDADADDLTQDAFVRVVEKIDSVRQSERIESWIYQIARNVLVDFYRRRTKQAMQSAEDALEMPKDESNGNLNRAIGKWLSLMINRLPDTVRDAVRMYEIEELPQSDIAERLHLSLSGAKSRIQRGRRQLKKMLHECCRLERDSRGNILECSPNSAEACAEKSCECSSGVQAAP
jgi:RNA polymerase sigma-70 factor, ECF subfamily